MKRINVGIDFSTTSCAICINKDGKNHFVSIVNRWEFTAAQEFDKEKLLQSNPILSDLYKLDNFYIEIVDRKPLSIPDAKTNREGRKKGLDLLSEWHRTHYHQTQLWSESIFRILNSVLTGICEGKPSKNDIVVMIEFYNMGKTSTNPYHVAEFTYPLKKLLLDNVVAADNFYVISPPEVKMAAGKGDYRKWEMVMSFVGDNCSDEFSQFVVKNKDKILKPTKKELVPVKPIDDLVDSYFICKELMRRVPNQ